MMSSLMSEPAGTEAEDKDKASLFWNNLSSAFLSLSILMCFLDAVSAFIRTSTPVDLMKSSVYSLKKENFLFRLSKPASRDEDWLDVPGSDMV